MGAGQNTYNLNFKDHVLTISDHQTLHGYKSVPRETDTFKSMAARSFNSLPDSVRQLTDYHTFAKATRKYLFQKLKTQVV